MGDGVDQQPQQILEMTRYDIAGAVQRRVRCLPGRITVLRGSKPELVTQYQLALEGKLADPSLRITVGDAPYAPHHAVVLTGEDIAPLESPETLQGYLDAVGISGATREVILNASFLCAKRDAAVSTLTIGELQAFRILVGICSPKKIVVIDDPFLVVPAGHREELSKLMAQLTLEKNCSVVIVNLTFRPTEWIENEVVARIQLERPRSRTIGFGGEAPGGMELLNKLRQEEAALDTAVATPLKDTGSSTALSMSVEDFHRAIGVRARELSGVVTTPEVEKARARREWRLLTSGVLTLGVVMGGVALLLQYRQSQELLAARVVSEPPPVVAPVVSQAAPQPSVVLASYPATVRQSIERAFLDPEGLLKELAARGVPAAPIVDAVASAPTEYGGIQGDPSYQEGLLENRLTEEELERRRESIRERFVAAMQEQAGMRSAE